MSAETIFNPYQAWLGIATNEGRPDHYRLLGLERLEGDRQTISSAADKTKARVRSQRPGEHARQWAALLDEIDVAKATLLSVEMKAAYDAALPVSGDRAQAAKLVAEAMAAAGTAEEEQSEGEHLSEAGPGFPKTAPGSFAPPAFAPLDVVLGKPGAALHPAAQLLGLDDEAPVFEESPAESFHDHPSENDPFDPMAPVTFDELEPASMEAPAAAPIPAPPVPAAPLPLPPIEKTFTATRIEAPQFAPEAPSMAAEVRPEIKSYQAPGNPAFKPAPRAKSTSKWIFTAIAAGVLILLTGAVVVVVMQGGFSEAVAVTNSAETRQPTDSSPATSASTSTSTSTSPAPLKNVPERPTNGSTDSSTPPVVHPDESSPVDPPDDSTSAMPEETMPEEMTPTEPPTDSMPEETTPVTTIEPLPTGEPAVETEPPKPLSVDEISALSKSLVAARAALAKQNVALAQSELAKAASLARGEPYSSAYERLASLAAAVGDFWAAFDRGAASLKPAQELTFGSTSVKIVEATKEHLSYEVAGNKLKRKLREAPLGLAIAIAEKGMTDPQSAQSKLQKGAPLALQASEAQVNQARTYFKEAEQQGAGVQNLIAAIDDKYEFAGSDTPSTANPSASSLEMTARVGKLLAASRQALVDREMERAAADLAKAEQILGKSPSDEQLFAKYDRLRLLTDYLKQFWSIVGDSMAALEVGEEIFVRDTPVAVISADRQSLEIRTEGQSRRYTLGDIPAGLALALAQMRLKENDPATKMMSAALYAVQKDESHHATALRLWEEAAAAGADVGDLPMVIEDSYAAP